MIATAEMDRVELARFYERAAECYLAELPLEHFMEATPQATQREITIASFALIRAVRPDVHLFNELLIQYFRHGEESGQLARVVPDNMVVVYPGRIEANLSYNLPLQPAAPLLVLEYVSAGNRRKDYDDNKVRYGRDVKVQYYLLFEPELAFLTIFQLFEGKYVPLVPNAAGRLAVPELELEAAMLGGWVRFWFRGELLPLPAEMFARLGAAERAKTKAEQAKTKAELAKTKAEQVAVKDRAARTEAELARNEAERLATLDRAARVEAERLATEDRVARISLEAEIALLRERLEKFN